MSFDCSRCKKRNPMTSCKACRKARDIPDERIMWFSARQGLDKTYGIAEPSPTQTKVKTCPKSTL
jgi:hypothetical protein